MLLPNPSFASFGEVVFEDVKPFCVLGSDGLVSHLPPIDNTLRAEDFNVSVQQAMGSVMSFNASYVPVEKLQDFEGIVSMADNLLSSEIIPENPPSNPETSNEN